MAKNYSRTQRIADLIQTTLAEILQKQAKDLRFGFITVTGVTVSPNLAFAKVYVSVLAEEKAPEVVAALNKATKYLRYELANAVELRITPQLKFIYDDSVVRGSRISSLINAALKNHKE
jgi:ribosome-binding factor A